MTDQLERLFGELRADTMPRIVPPGVDAARSTVRRRRRRATAITTAGLVALVAAGIGLSPQPARHSTAGPALPAADRWALAQKASERIDQSPGDSAISGIAIETGQQTYPLVAGDYEVTTACYGAPGYVAAEVAGKAFTVTCEETPPVLTVPVTVPASDQPTVVSLRPDSATEGRTGIAYSLKMTQAAQERLRVAAQEAVGNSSYSAISGFLTQGGDGLEDQTMRAGNYRLTVACVGAGTVKVQIGPEKPGEPGVAAPFTTLTQECGHVPALGHLDVTIPKGTKTTVIDVTPSAEATGQAAAAVRVDRR
ncbi:hypothetical protein [Actinoplanes sp. NPDC020271]|uniref:hypothetical protein n=1 Tax=Actinoplanes sp. NPDC020271 TaxID=3363896 RepID=UPI00378A7278